MLAIFLVSSVLFSCGISFTVFQSPSSVEESLICPSGENVSLDLPIEFLNCSGSEGSCLSGLFCSDGCKCRKYPNDFVRCEDEDTATSLMVLNNYCINFDKQTKAVLVGACVESISATSSYLHLPYYTVCPGKLNEFCTKMNKMGALCGSCMHGYFPQAYSFNMTCVQCPHPHWNWLWYIIAAYFPLTLFYVLILIFKVNTMSGHVHFAICICQALSSAILIRSVSGHLENRTDFRVILTKVVLSIYGIWNLDFFRPFYSELCLGIGVLPTLALDYVIAVYPLFLMLVSYLMIKLYDRNCKVVKIVFSPLQKLFFLFRKNWDIKSTLTDAFATFFFLSNVKFLTVSFDLLVPTTVYHIDGDNVTQTRGLYYSADIEYFGDQHLPYAVLAIAVLCLCVIFPVALLAIYPFIFFQKFLNLFPFRWYILHTFMDSFQGCYKNGTEPGTRDCRSFLAVIFITRIFVFVIYAVTLNVMSFAIQGLMFVTASVVFMAVKPFKTTANNTAAIAYFLLLIFVCVTYVVIKLSSFMGLHQLNTFLTLLSYLAFFVPLVDAIRVCGKVLVRKRRSILQRVVYCLRHRQINEYEELSGCDREEERLLSDRIENPEAYPPKNLSNFGALRKEDNKRQLNSCSHSVSL